MLMKLTPGVNFINILRAAFLSADPESAKKTDNLTVFFVLLGSASVKAASRTLMKLTPGVYSNTICIRDLDKINLIWWFDFRVKHLLLPFQMPKKFKSLPK